MNRHCMHTRTDGKKLPERHDRFQLSVYILDLQHLNETLNLTTASQ